ncbi:hypothetical protein AB1L07_01765 [Niallia alba]|uniref:hypothetical protein n=1 Tax=Niallia alba TaxID=2729105 RepID=UPI0039A0538A
MIEINVSVEVPTTTVETRTAVYKDFIDYAIKPVNRVVDVNIGYYDSSQNEISREYISITGEHYEMLMSESPDYAPNKPAGDCRREDIWYVLGLMGK